MAHNGQRTAGLAARISQIIRSRADRKGIVHTVSYRRAQFLLDNLDVGDVPVLSHNSSNTRATVEKFKKLPRGGVIVSPSLATGYDFPYDLCRYQIIGKVPWPDTRDPVMEARKKRDKEYPAYIAAQQLVQMAGRGMRAADDLSETFVVDDFFDGMLAAYRHLFPRSFLGGRAVGTDHSRRAGPLSSFYLTVSQHGRYHGGHHHEVGQSTHRRAVADGNRAAQSGRSFQQRQQQRRLVQWARSA